jgi:hypothetical protein
MPFQFPTDGADYEIERAAANAKSYTKSYAETHWPPVHEGLRAGVLLEPRLRGVEGRERPPQGALRYASGGNGVMPLIPGFRMHPFYGG